MQQNEPTKDEMNEVIAFFDGYEKYEDENGIWFKKEGLIKCLHPKLQDLKYHTSWDALMPVVEKIETPEIDPKAQTIIRSVADVEIFYKACIIEYEPDEDSDDPNEGIRIQTAGKTKLEAVCNAVYKFILWIK